MGWELRLRSDGTKALIDSGALEIIGKGSRGELTTRLRRTWYLSHRASVASSRGTNGETGILH